MVKEEADRAASIDAYTKTEADALLAQKQYKTNGWGRIIDRAFYRQRVSGGEANTVAYVLPEGTRQPTM